MNRESDKTKEHRVVMPAPGASRCRTPWWSLMVVSVALCAAPVAAQKRVHNPHTQPKPTPAPPKPAPTPPKPPASPTQPTSPAPAAPKPNPPAPTAPTPTPKPAPQQNPAPTNPTPTPTPQAPPKPETNAMGAAEGVRGLLIGRDANAGTITVGRNGFPPLTLRVGNGAAISRDGDPAPLSALETGSQAAVPDAVMVSATVAADGKPVATKIKAASRDHFWHGRLTGIDPSSSSITVTRGNGQRRVFHLHTRTNLIQFGKGNVEWTALKIGATVEVVWIPGDSDDNAPVLEAHMVVLGKPYEGMMLRPPVRR